MLVMYYFLAIPLHEISWSFCVDVIHDICICIVYMHTPDLNNYPVCVSLMKEYYWRVGRRFSCKLAARFIRLKAQALLTPADYTRQRRRCEILDPLAQTATISKPTNSASQNTSYKKWGVSCSILRFVGWQLFFRPVSGQQDICPCLHFWSK